MPLQELEAIRVRLAAHDETREAVIKVRVYVSVCDMGMERDGDQGEGGSVCPVAWVYRGAVVFVCREKQQQEKP